MKEDESLDELIKEDSAQSQAVRSLISVKDRKAGQGSEIELKTELTKQEAALHTSAQIMGDLLRDKKLTDLDILGKIVTLKERKNLSLDRKSRKEIVEVARTPDMPLVSGMENAGMVKRFFTSRRNQI